MQRRPSSPFLSFFFSHPPRRRRRRGRGLVRGGVGRGGGAARGPGEGAGRQGERARGRRGEARRPALRQGGGGGGGGRRRGGEGGWEAPAAPLLPPTSLTPRARAPDFSLISAGTAKSPPPDNNNNNNNEQVALRSISTNIQTPSGSATATPVKEHGRSGGFLSPGQGVGADQGGFKSPGLISPIRLKVSAGSGEKRGRGHGEGVFFLPTPPFLALFWLLLARRPCRRCLRRRPPRRFSRASALMSSSHRTPRAASNGLDCGLRARTPEQKPDMFSARAPLGACYSEGAKKGNRRCSTPSTSLPSSIFMDFSSCT